MHKLFKIFIFIFIFNGALFASSNLRNYFLEESFNKKSSSSSNKSGLSFKSLDNKLYFTGSINYSNLNFSRSDTGTSVLNEELKKDGHAIILELGYDYNWNWDTSFNYQRSQNGNTTLDNIYISALYKFKKQDKYRPYTGFNLGYSMLSWDENTFNKASSDLKSSNFLLGVNLGSIYEINQKYSLDFRYQINYAKHKTFVENQPTGSTNLSHDFLQTVGLGIRYNF